MSNIEVDDMQGLTTPEKAYKKARIMALMFFLQLYIYRRKLIIFLGIITKHI